MTTTPTPFLDAVANFGWLSHSFQEMASQTALSSASQVAALASDLGKTVAILPDTKGVHDELTRLSALLQERGHDATAIRFGLLRFQEVMHSITLHRTGRLVTAQAELTRHSILNGGLLTQEGSTSGEPADLVASALVMFNRAPAKGEAFHETIWILDPIARTVQFSIKDLMGEFLDNAQVETLFWRAYKSVEMGRLFRWRHSEFIQTLERFKTRKEYKEALLYCKNIVEGYLAHGDDECALHAASKGGAILAEHPELLETVGPVSICQFYQNAAHMYGLHKLYGNAALAYFKATQYSEWNGASFFKAAEMLHTAREKDPAIVPIRLVLFFMRQGMIATDKQKHHNPHDLDIMIAALARMEMILADEMAREARCEEAGRLYLDAIEKFKITTDGELLHKTRIDLALKSAQKAAKAAVALS